MLHDTGVQKYVNWEVTNVIQIKNKYGFRIVLHYLDGTKKIQQKSGFLTKKVANEERNKTIGALYSGTYIVYTDISVNDFYVHWLEDDIKNRVRSSNTYNSFKNIVYNYILPMLGTKKLINISKGDVQDLYKVSALKSPSSVRNVKTVMNISLKYAVSKKMLSTNPAENVPLPKHIKAKPYRTRNINSQKTLTLEQLYTLIEASKNTPIYLQVLFNALMGLRRSEIIGLKYSDIDFVEQTLTIQRQLGKPLDVNIEEIRKKTLTKQELGLKTPSSYRTLKIPDYVFQAILEQRKIYEKNKSKRKKEFLDEGYICCSTYGHSRSKDFHYKYFKKILEENNLPNIRWHDLRSSYCTLLLKMNFSPKAVSNLMGHAKELITVDVYGDNAQLVSDNTDALDEFIKEIFTEDSKNEYLKEMQESDPDFDIDCEIERMFGFFDCSPIL